MPWKKTEPMTETERFVTLSQTGRFTVAELCVDFGISRKTGHKYLKRYRADGLPDRSRRPKHSPNATVKFVEALILKSAVSIRPGAEEASLSINQNPWC